MSFRLFGFEVIITTGSFLLFALIFFMAFSALPPYLPDSVKIPLGISATVVLLAMLLAHELSHALVAKSRGISVHHIGFFPFGAGTALEQESRTPGDEFFIAVVGPFTSIGVGVAASIASAMFRTGIGISMLEGYLSLLLDLCGYWSIVLGIFNLLPAFPVDGGRMVRAILWFFFGLRNGTRAAAFLSIFIASAMMVLGIFSGDLWLAFLGIFIFLAARNTLQQYP